MKRISVSSKVNHLSTKGALMYTWILAHLDYNGSFYGDPAIIKGLVFPKRREMSVRCIKNELINMLDLGLVKLYENNGSDYIFIPDFLDKQPKIQKDREGKSEIPAPPEEYLNPESSQDSTPESSQAQIKIKEVKLKEVKLKPEMQMLFVETWDNYEKQIQKKKCKEWYIKNVKTEEKHREIMDGIQRWKESGQWDDPQFQPYPYKFLNNEMWKDNPPKKQLSPKDDEIQRLLHEEVRE